MQILKKIDVMSCGKIVGLFGILFGLIMGVIYALNGPSMIAMAPELAAMSYLFSWWAIIIMPIYMGLIYFLAGIIGAALYNVFSKKIGGIKIDLAKK